MATGIWYGPSPRGSAALRKSCGLRSLKTKRVAPCQSRDPLLRVCHPKDCYDAILPNLPAEEKRGEQSRPWQSAVTAIARVPRRALHQHATDHEAMRAAKT